MGLAPKAEGPTESSGAAVLGSRLDPIEGDGGAIFCHCGDGSRLSRRSTFGDGKRMEEGRSDPAVGVEALVGDGALMEEEECRREGGAGLTGVVVVADADEEEDVAVVAVNTNMQNTHT
jgi:hypothetical protein